MALALPAGLVWANHVRMEGGNDSPPGVIYAPPGSAVVVHRTAGRNRTNSTISVGFIASRPHEQSQRVIRRVDRDDLIRDVEVLNLRTRLDTNGARLV
jgi:hypothetical protein